MSNVQTIPCIKLPSGGSFSISLPFGGQLTSVIDLSKGPPTDCTLIHGLMLQLGPALAGMQCILKLRNTDAYGLEGPAGLHDVMLRRRCAIAIVVDVERSSQPIAIRDVPVRAGPKVAL